MLGLPDTGADADFFRLGGDSISSIRLIGAARAEGLALSPRDVFEGRTPAGEVTDGLIDYHLAVAQGGVGLTTVAYLAIAPEGRTHREQIVVGPDTQKGLARLAEAVREAAPSGRGAAPGPVLEASH